MADWDRGALELAGERGVDARDLAAYHPIQAEYAERVPCPPSTLADVVGRLKRRRGGGDELLAYKNGRRWQDIKSTDINAWLKEATGEDISAKDFRTWGATVLAAVALAVSERAPETKTGRKRAIVRAVKEVSHYLGNTPAVARASYIDPRVIDRFTDGETIDHALVSAAAENVEDGTAIQGPVEKAVLELLAS